MLPSHLNTNEVKNAAGTEVEFLRQGASVNNALVFAQSGEAPNAQHRLKVSHQEIGAGVKKRRRSMRRVDKVVTGVDGNPVTITDCHWTDIPVGNLATLDSVKDVIAEGLSFDASTGADTTIKFDCSGNGASTLLNGTL